MRISEESCKFSDGRIDYSTSDTAPVVTVFVKHKGEMVLVKRSSEVRTHHGKWDTIAGYLDQMKPIRMKVLEGIQEECGTGESQVSSIRAGKVYECVARAYCHYEPPSMFGPVRTNIRLVDRLCW